MKAKPESMREGPLRIPLKFDEAIKHSLKVKPPSEGWAEYERKLKHDRQRKRKKKAN